MYKRNITQITKGREIFRVKPINIKRAIVKCYKKNVTQQENLELYTEISNLLGLYVFVKENPSVETFIVIPF